MQRVKIISKKDWQELKEKQMRMCLLCGRSEPAIRLTIDHIIPMARWTEWAEKNNPDYGMHDRKNLQALCHSCNASKNDNVHGLEEPEPSKEIDPSKEYTLYHLVKIGVFPWVRGYRKYHQVVMADGLGKNVLKAEKVKRGGRGMQYKIKGENLMRYLHEQDRENT